MDFDEIMKKVGSKMNDVRDVVLDFTDKAGKKAGEVYGDAKVKIKLADVQRDINSLYKEIGAAAYTANRAGEDISAVINDKCAEVERLYAEMEEIAKNLTKEKADGVVYEADDDDIVVTESASEETPEETTEEAPEEGSAE